MRGVAALWPNCLSSNSADHQRVTLVSALQAGPAKPLQRQNKKYSIKIFFLLNYVVIGSIY